MRKAMLTWTIVTIFSCTVHADVFNMGPDLTSLETVPVGNPGNLGQWAGETHGGYGPDRICGAVAYSYSLGKYEVTAGQYCEFLNKVAGEDSFGLYNINMWTSTSGCRIERFAGSGASEDPYQYRVASDWADRPVNYVSWGDAARFCNWLHNGQPSGPQGPGTTENGAYFMDIGLTREQLLAVERRPGAKWAIPSEDEWHKAAYHKNDGTDNYWGYPISNCGHPINDLTTPDGGYNANFLVLPDDYTLGAPYYRTEVGEFELSESPYDTFDQGGNVAEWTEAIIWEIWRGSAGGSYNYTSPGMSSSYRNVMNPVAESGPRGFRVVQVPEPAGLSLLGIGMLGLSRKRVTSRRQLRLFGK